MSQVNQLVDGTYIIGQLKDCKFVEGEEYVIINKNRASKVGDFHKISMVGKFSGIYATNAYRMTEGKYIFSRKDKKYTFTGSTLCDILETGILADNDGTITINYKNEHITYISLTNSYSINIRHDNKIIMYHNIFPNNIDVFENYDIYAKGKKPGVDSPIARKINGEKFVTIKGTKAAYDGEFKFNENRELLIHGKCKIFVYDDASVIETFISNDDDRAQIIKKYELPEVI